uniref:Uncharacterized protein n=1 Tax=Anguilla anguilla TaxID=7936 RepID=A0A0E9X7M8_ANGAN
MLLPVLLSFHIITLMQHSKKRTSLFSMLLFIQGLCYLADSFYFTNLMFKVLCFCFECGCHFVFRLPLQLSFRNK